MIVAVFFLALVVALFVAFGVWWLRRDADHLLSQLERTTVVATMKDGVAFRGVLFEVDARTVVLRQAQLLTPEKSVTVDGDLVIARGDISYLQRP